MNPSAPDATPRDARSGFTIVELLIVVGIIAVMAAVALPSISKYMRNYQIKAAQQQVGGEINAARTKAIMKNANFGVVFLTVDATHYRWVVEDAQPPCATSVGTRVSLNTLLTDSNCVAQRGTLQTLPQGVVFDATNTGVCALPTGTWTADMGLRYNRLGAWCDPSGSSTLPGQCPDLTNGTALVQNSSVGSFICLSQATTGLKRSIQVAPGGRVLQSQ